jgi:hypothetical protein
MTLWGNIFGTSGKILIIPSSADGISEEEIMFMKYFLKYTE